MAAHNELGKWGEDVAAEYLVKRGYTIVERDWRFRRYDIDIIAVRDDEELLFVEVKTRSNSRFGNPYDAVNSQKARNLLSAAQAFIRQCHTDLLWRFDIISIVGTPDNYTLEQIENAINGLWW